MTLGRICTVIIRAGPHPTAFAASMYCCSLTLSTDDRTTRAARGMIGIEIAMITLSQGWPQDRHGGQREDQARERHENVGDTLDDIVRRAAKEGPHQSEDTADDTAHDRRGEPHQQRDLSAVEDHAQHVAA